MKAWCLLVGGRIYQSCLGELDTTLKCVAALKTTLALRGAGVRLALCPWEGAPDGACYVQASTFYSASAHRMQVMRV